MRSTRASRETVLRRVDNERKDNMYNHYVREKLMELYNERSRQWQPRPAGTPAFAVAMRAAGAALRRVGGRLESRGAPPEGEPSTSLGTCSVS